MYFAKDLVIYPDVLVVTFGLGKRQKNIPLSDLIAWTEVERTEKKSTWLELRLYSSAGRLKFTTREFANYGALKMRLTAGLPQDLKKEARTAGKGKLGTGIGFLTAAAVLFAIAYSSGTSQCPIRSRPLLCWV